MSGYFSGFVNSVKGFFGYEDLEVVSGGSGEDSKDNAAQEERKSLWKQLSSYIGKDITSMISLPVWIFEPLSFLQIICEPLQFVEVLQKAGEHPDPAYRLAFLAAFVSGGYSCATRTKKPFNPILGETFEFISKDKGWKYFAEQVTHHPPMGVGEASYENFIIHLEMELKTRFRGNSTEVTVSGLNWIKFLKFGDIIEWGHMDTCASNVIIGGMWVDHYGTVEFKNIVSGERCVLKFTKAGWLGAGRYNTSGEVFDKNGKLRLRISGKWNESIVATEVKSDGTDGETTTLWKRSPPPKGPWNWNEFNWEMNKCPPEYEAVLPPTDSRLRTDRRELERGNQDLAGKEKHRLEEKQRAEKREREAKGEVYKPKYFEMVEKDGRRQYNYVGKYWEEREQRIKEKSEQNLVAQTQNLSIQDSKAEK